jgi:predicted transcriptional regulator of viral defense system
LWYFVHVAPQWPSPKTLPEYVDRLQQSGRYTFNRDQALGDLSLSPVAVKRAAERLIGQGRLIAPRRGFFVIVPLEYKSAGAPPPSWFIDELMRYHQQPYYVGLLSAAALHGAAAQQPQEFQVITNQQLRPATVGRSRVRFLLKKHVGRTPTVTIKTETGSMRASTPEATAVDLVRYPEHVGGWNNIAEVIAGLAEKIDANRLAEAARIENDVAAAQRAGFLFERVGAADKTGPLAAWIEVERARVVALRADREAVGAPKDQRWRVLVNEEIEVAG